MSAQDAAQEGRGDGVALLPMALEPGVWYGDFLDEPEDDGEDEASFWRPTDNMVWPADGRIADYHIDQALAIGLLSGTMTYLVHHLDDPDQRLVVLKMLPRDLGGSGQFRQRFRCEMEAASRIKHPNVVPVQDAGEDKATGCLYQVMPFFPNGNLGDWPVSPNDRDTLAAIVQDIGRGLQALHDAGLVHGSLKRSNILMDDKGCAVIGDLGLSRDQRLGGGEDEDDEDAMPVMLAALPRSPEQGQGEEATPASDIYAFACLILEMLTGLEAADIVFSFDGPTPAFVPDPPRIRDYRRDLSVKVETLLCQALAQDPEARPSSVAAFAEAVALELTSGKAPHRRVFSKRVVVAGPLTVGRAMRLLVRGVCAAPGAIMRTWRSPATQRVYRLTATALFLCAVGFFGFSMWQKRQNLLAICQRPPDFTTKPAKRTYPLSPKDLALRPPWATDFGKDALGLWSDLTVSTATQRFRRIKPGVFLMGSPDTELDRVKKEETLHEVTLSRGFWMAETECTQAFWVAVMEAKPAAGWSYPGSDRPAEQVSWRDAERFLAKLNVRFPKLEARLPSEAEWEYCCRAGTKGAFSYGGSLYISGANYDSSIPYGDEIKAKGRGETTPVRTFMPNAFGLYDMHGNLAEWCSDWYGPYPEGPVTDPVGPKSDLYSINRCIVRGGSYEVGARMCRSAFRGSEPPDNSYRNVGFRFIGSAPMSEAEKAAAQQEAAQQEKTEPVSAP